MTDLALTTVEDAPAAPPSRRRKLLLLALPLIAVLAGGAASYMGYVAPLAILCLGGGAAATGAEAEAEVVFVDLPAINVTLPDANPRLLHLVGKLETDEASREAVEHLLPRVSDAFNTFLTGIAPAAFDRRGILEVVREELVTRARQAVGEGHHLDVLVTEFTLK